MNKIVPISIGVVIIAALAYISFQSATKVSTSVVQKQEERMVEPTTGAPADTTAMPSKAETSTLVTGITLTVSAPANNSTVTDSSVTVKGKTVANAEVFVNDVETKADANGNFSVTLTLDEGDNYILVVANDINGNYSEKDLTVTYSP